MMPGQCGKRGLSSIAWTLSLLVALHLPTIHCHEGEHAPPGEDGHRRLDRNMVQDKEWVVLGHRQSVLYWETFLWFRITFVVLYKFRLVRQLVKKKGAVVELYGVQQLFLIWMCSAIHTIYYMLASKATWTEQLTSLNVQCVTFSKFTEHW